MYSSHLFIHLFILQIPIEYIRVRLKNMAKILCSSSYKFVELISSYLSRLALWLAFTSRMEQKWFTGSGFWALRGSAVSPFATSKRSSHSVVRCRLCHRMVGDHMWQAVQPAASLSFSAMWVMLLCTRTQVKLAWMLPGEISRRAF